MRIAQRLSLIAIFAAAAGVGSASASAETLEPWWHLTSIARPTYLQPGQARDAVWRLTVEASSGTFELRDHGVGQLGEGAGSDVTLTVGEDPVAVREALEGAYGPGNVEVTGVPGTNNPDETYEIKFVGELAFRPVGIEVEKSTEDVAGGSGEIKLYEVVEGRPDGYLVVSATNLGDAPANPATHPVVLTDILPRELEAVGIEGTADENLSESASKSAVLACELGSLSCTFTGAWPGKGRKPAYPSVVPSYFGLQMRVAVNFKEGANSAEVNEASVAGGEAPAATVRQSLAVSTASTSFGAGSYEMRPEEAGGSLDTQAGSHPFQLTTTLTVNQGVEGRPVALAKDLHFKLPAGLIGNPTPFPRCTMPEFFTRPKPACPADTVVGVAIPTIRTRVFAAGGILSLPFQEALYNLEPAAGEPARFGFSVDGGEAFVVLNTAVRTGSDYGVTVSVSNISEAAEFVSSEVTFWGVPGAASHDKARGADCLENEESFAKRGEEPDPCPALEEASPPPLLSLPTTCATNRATGSPEPLQTFVEGDSWQEPQRPFAPVANTAPMPALAGCDLDLQRFDPNIAVKPDVQEASRPSGLTVDVHVPQEGQLNAEAVAESNVKDIQVTLPAGLTLSPSAANGLEACSGNPGEEPESQGNEIGFTGSTEPNPGSEPGNRIPMFTPRLPGSTDALEAGETASLQPGANFCPNASKIGEATITTPLLPEKQPVKGFVYLASPQNFNVFPQENPFETHVAMYIVAEDPISGALVKLPGKVELGGAPGVEGLAQGQIRSTFENTPQLAFEDAELHFFGGERAPLATPSRCGAYTTNATFMPWAAEPSDEALVKVSSSSTFHITSGPNGTPCPASSLPFSPSLASGTTNNNAGSFAPLTTTLSREDGQQPIQSVTLHFPAGLSGLLSGVKLCGEAEANAGTCGPESEIGETIVSVGLGGDPFTVTGGKAYITGPYDGAPFGLSIVNPAKAGPFDLQQGRPVVVRAKIEVDPLTAALTITTDKSGSAHAIPTIVEGFPLQIKHVNVLVNRPGFTFNPTNCTPTAVTGAIGSAEGASSPVSVPFQATNCASLKFTPKFTVSSSGKTSKAYGADLVTKVTEPNEAQGSQANIARVKVELPKQLPSRLTTLQKACTNKQFEANPAACPPESKIGYATVHTPLLPVSLRGPAIFVSHGGEAFPSLTMVLQGYGVTIDLVGTTFISKAGVTSTTFKTVPDQPFSTFELTLPEGKFSALTALGNLCTEKLTMPTEFVGQNGAATHISTPVGVTGCVKTRALTRAQKLTKALKVCRKDKKKTRRASCERAARKKYGPLKKAKKKTKKSKK